MQFRKYQGLGNDFILMDFRSNPLLFPLNETAQFLCHRRFGIGADGLILALPPQNGGDVRMQIINADGTEAEMCGNGVRCFARFLADLDNLPDFSSWRVETAAGLIVPQLIAGQQVAVDMGEPLLNPEAIPTTISEGLPLAEACLEVAGEQFVVAAVGMGNPHAVVQVPKIEAIDLARFGPALEAHPAFPARTNVHFVEVVADHYLRLLVWERGAGATLACGTGACAALVATHLRGSCAREADVELPGGVLHINWDARNRLQMTGPAEFVFSGSLPPSFDSYSSSAESIDCSKLCSEGCINPEACPSANARAKAMAVLSDFSLDQLVNLANESVEQRTLRRISGS